ncbi:MAG: hypothetical protein IKI69_02230 [Oscillospiraceae bacterium]|nr:hypothetical protein [Oscillospiraceae bacterium]
MLGKEKCRMLKEIRRRIAEENDIPYVTRECTHRGDCRGTCPRCEAELRELERKLEGRKSIGKRVSVAALCAGLVVTNSACTRADVVELFPALREKLPIEDDIQGMMSYDPERLDGEISNPETELDGDIQYFPETGEILDQPEE